MTYSTTSSVRTAGLRDRLSAFFAAIAEGAQRRRVYNSTVRELSQLSDRELADLGVHRSSISTVAAEAALLRT